jgi:Capsule polysaccharide biosynthesis protein
MNVSVVLNYFNYFIPFGKLGNLNRYVYLTDRGRFKKMKEIPVEYCEPGFIPGFISGSEVRQADYFGQALKTGSLSGSTDLEELALLYETFFYRHFEKHKTDLIISGGSTAFERYGIACAKKHGIKTLCVWEGFFRPDTISFDKDGMNCESSFSKLQFGQIMKHEPSAEFESFYDSHLALNNFSTTGSGHGSLKEVQGDRFRLIPQIKNRWMDRHDTERIRLPLRQLAAARISFYFRRYSRIRDLKKPFILFPLQTHTDSSLIIGGNLFPFDEYLTLVSESFLRSAISRDYYLVIKEHPFDVFRKRYKMPRADNIIILDPASPMREIFGNQLCSGTIVVNSTAGLESLLWGKPVVTLGRSVYSYNELVIIPVDLSVEKISAAMETLVNQNVDPDRVKQFCGALFDRMQFRGTLDKLPGPEEIAATEKTIKNIYEKL